MVLEVPPRIWQFFATVIAGLVLTWHVALLVAETVCGSQAMSVPKAITVSVNGPHRLPVGV